MGNKYFCLDECGMQVFNLIHSSYEKNFHTSQNFHTLLLLHVDVFKVVTCICLSQLTVIKLYGLHTIFVAILFMYRSNI